MGWATAVVREAEARPAEARATEARAGLRGGGEGGGGDVGQGGADAHRPWTACCQQREHVAPQSHVGRQLQQSSSGGR